MSRSLTVALSAAGALALAACAYNETLGRNQFLIVDDSALTQQSEAAWAEALRTQPTSNDATSTPTRSTVLSASKRRSPVASGTYFTHTTMFMADTARGGPLLCTRVDQRLPARHHPSSPGRRATRHMVRGG